MAINPMKLLPLKGKFDKAKAGHPKLMQFLNAVSGRITEGNVITIKVTFNDGQEVETNMKVNAADVDLLRAARDL